MHVTILGAAGMLGRKLAARLGADGRLGDTPLERLTLADVVAPEPPSSSFGGEATCVALDLAEPGAADRLLADRPDVVVHLAAVVSGEAEADFDKGYSTNLDGTRALLEAIRGIPGFCPRVVFASSIAVFGAPFPPRIGDDHLAAPLTSYGTQKAIGELLLGDYSRRGFLDGVALRLPTVCVRPGAPNKAASGFFSNILREPLAGREAVLPVSEVVRHWFASPRAAVEYLLRAASMDLSPLGARRTLTLPGISATVGEQIAALRRLAGEKAVGLIRREPDPVIAGIVAGWPENFDAARALALGFTPDADMDAILRVHVEDERGGRVGA